MSPSASNPSGSVRQAESAVNNSIVKFESAMDELAFKMEDTTSRLHHVVDTVKKPVEDLIQLKDRVTEVTSPLIEDVRSNPRPWIIAGAALAAGFLAFTYMPGRESSVPRTADGRQY